MHTRRRLEDGRMKQTARDAHVATEQMQMESQMPDRGPQTLPMSPKKCCSPATLVVTISALRALNFPFLVSVYLT